MGGEQSRPTVAAYTKLEEKPTLTKDTHSSGCKITLGSFKTSPWRCWNFDPCGYCTDCHACKLTLGQSKSDQTCSCFELVVGEMHFDHSPRSSSEETRTPVDSPRPDSIQTNVPAGRDDSKVGNYGQEEVPSALVQNCDDTDTLPVQDRDDAVTLPLQGPTEKPMLEEEAQLEKKLKTVVSSESMSVEGEVRCAKVDYVSPSHKVEESHGYKAEESSDQQISEEMMESTKVDAAEISSTPEVLSESEII